MSVKCLDEYSSMSSSETLPILWKFWPEIMAGHGQGTSMGQGFCQVFYTNPCLIFTMIL